MVLFIKKDGLMNKKSALSSMGYAIVLVIILGIGMIISAPMLANKYKDDAKDAKNNNNQQLAETSASRNGNNLTNDGEFINITEEMHNIERRLSSRINDLEMRQNDLESSTSEDYAQPEISDKYICEIEGVKNEYGNTVPINDETDISTQKIVFVCEYRQ